MWPRPALKMYSGNCSLCGLWASFYSYCLSTKAVVTEPPVLNNCFCSLSWCVCVCVFRGVSVLWQGVLGDLHLPGTILSDAEPKLSGHQRFHWEQQQGQGGRGLQLRHVTETGHAADRQHLQPPVHRCHPGQERYNNNVVISEGCLQSACQVGGKKVN